MRNMSVFFCFLCFKGVDIDGRLDEADEFLPVMEYRLQGQLAFFKALPRFTELETRDKYALLKGRRQASLTKVFFFSSDEFLCRY